MKNGAVATCRVFSPNPWTSNAGIHAATTRVLGNTAGKLARNEVTGSGLCTAGDVFAPDQIYSLLAAPKEPELIVEYFDQ
jgi:hypothetical protein